MRLACWLLIALYAAARVLQVYPGRAPMLAVVALHVLAPAIFALLHGARLYGRRGIVVFTAVCLVVGNAFENLGVRTGFPYGHYYFTSLMGPKLGVVPVLLGLAYVGMAYLSWTLARLILDGGAPVALPITAALILVAWDLSQEPVWSTILRAWVCLNGGPYFGVPLSNFFGWFLAAACIYSLFALYLRGSGAGASSKLPAAWWRQAVLFYAVSAAGNLLLPLPSARYPVVTDATGAQWKVSDITGTTAVVTIFTMGAFALLAWLRIAATSSSPSRRQGRTG